MLVRVVDERDVDAVQAKAVQARVQAAPDAIGGEIELAYVPRGDRETPWIGAVRRQGWLQQPADLGGDRKLRPGAISQRVTESSFG